MKDIEQEGLTNAYGKVSAEQVKRRELSNRIIDLFMELVDARNENLPTGKLQGMLAELIAQL
jgi:hypothetical protein